MNPTRAEVMRERREREGGSRNENSKQRKEADLLYACHFSFNLHLNYWHCAKEKKKRKKNYVAGLDIREHKHISGTLSKCKPDLRLDLHTGFCSFCPY